MKFFFKNLKVLYIFFISIKINLYFIYFILILKFYLNLKMRKFFYSLMFKGEYYMK
jgi:hypothetical protein